MALKDARRRGGNDHVISASGKMIFVVTGTTRSRGGEMKRYAIVAALLLLAVATCPRQAQAGDLGSGLEVTEYRNLTALVEPLDPDARNIGLTESVVRNRMELRLRAAGITPNALPNFADLGVFTVNITVVGAAFNVEVSFTRPVTYSVGQRALKKISPTWDAAITGTHGNKAASILDALDKLLDKFLNEYLRANQ
jgi:hypothetical protein